VGEGAHVLQFVGAHRDGARFDHISPPFRGDPDQRAREIAAELVAAATMINQQEDRSMPAPAPIAGLASTLRDHLREATARADQVARRAKESVSNLHQVLDAAEGTDVSKLVGSRHPHFVATLRKPVIAAINGACAGMGLTLALVCDVRFAADGAKFTTSFARRGLIAEYGISWILPRVVGWGAAMDLLLSGRVFLADEAAELGLVKEVVAPEELMPRAIAYAEDIAANCAPSSLAVIKQQVYADSMRDVFEASTVAEKLMHESMLRPDFIEGITSFFEKRPPNFPPLKGQEQ